MMRARMILRMVTSVLLLGATSASAQAGFTLYDFWTPNGVVSRDGSLIGGWAPSGFNGGPLAYLIDETGAIEIVSTGSGAQVNAINADGSVIAWVESDGQRIVRVDGVDMPMPDPGGGMLVGRLEDLSGDGSTLVGTLWDGNLTGWMMIYDVPTETYQAITPYFLYGEIEVPLGFTNVAGISTDGTTIVGSSNAIFHPQSYDAFKSDVSGQVEYLGTVGRTGGIEIGSASGVNSDGSVIVGRWSPLGEPAEVWRAEDGVVTDLGIVGKPRAVSGNGDRVVGHACFTPTCSGAWQSERAFYWQPDTGLHRLSDVLEQEYGFDLGGATLFEVSDISDDGLVMVGRGAAANGTYSTWVARLPQTIEVQTPEPGVGLGVAIGSLMATHSRRRQTRLSR